MYLPIFIIKYRREKNLRKEGGKGKERQGGKVRVMKERLGHPPDSRSRGQLGGALGGRSL